MWRWGGTFHPNGRADHTLATVLLWAMSAGLVRGVGFVPRWPLWRWLLSGYACFSALALYCIAKAALVFDIFHTMP